MSLVHDSQRRRNAGFAEIAAIAGDVTAILARVSAFTRRRRPSGTPAVPPRSALEGDLVRICADALRIDAIGITDNLFELNADSLAIVAIVTKVRHSFGVLLPIDSFFESPTVVAIARAIERQLSPDGSVKAPNKADPITAPVIAAWSGCAIQAKRPRHQYAAAVSVAARPGAAHAFLYSATVDSIRVVDQRIGQTLARCGTFKTLAEHAQHCAELWNEPPAQIEARLVALAHDGLLTRAGAFPGGVTVVSRAPVPIAMLAVPTRDRPESLRRCLDSYLQNFERHSRTVGLVVADDGPRESAQSVRELLTGIARRYDVTVDYLGWRERSRLATTLAQRAGVDPQVVRRGLSVDTDTPHLSTSGGVRNALLLAGSGRSILMVDDDTVCRTAQPFASGNRVVHAERGRGDLRDVAILRTLESCDEAEVGGADNVNVLAEHERVLGRSVADCNSSAPDAATGVGGWPDLDGHARVLVTIPGLMGDCGWGSPVEYLLTRPTWLASAGESHREVVERRSILRCAQDVVLTRKITDLMTTFVGVDLTDASVPFKAPGRGSDHLWANTLTRSRRGASFAHLPFTLAHLPVTQRRFWRNEAIRSAAGVDLAGLFTALLTFVAPDDERATAGPVALGAELRRLAELPIGELTHQSREAVTAMTVVRIRRCEELIADIPAEWSEWRDHVASYAAALRTASAHPDYWIPLDLQYGLGRADAVDASQRALRDFGILIENWPALMIAAQDVRSRSGALGAQIGPTGLAPSMSFGATVD